MLLVDRNKLTTFFFLLAYTTFYAFAMFGHIAGIGGYLKNITYFGIAILLILFFTRLHDYYAKEGIIFFILILWSLFIGYRVEDYGYFKLILMIAVSKNIDFNKCIKYDVFLRLLTIVLMYFLWRAGIAPDTTSAFGTIMRHSMGFQNPNHFGLLVFILILECLYLARMKFHFWLYAALIAILVFEDRIAGSRTSEVYSIALLIFTAFYAKLPNTFKKKGWQIFMQLNYVICAVLTAVSAHMMESGSQTMKALDSAFSGRITNVVYYNQLLGPTILGHSISFGNRTCDNLYAYLAICSGILVFIAVTVAYMLLIRDLYQYDNIPMAIAVFFLFAYGISERLWMNIDYNMMMLAFRQLIYHDVVPNIQMEKQETVYVSEEE